jgi:GTP cyclohydrolase II
VILRRRRARIVLITLPPHDTGNGDTLTETTVVARELDIPITTMYGDFIAGAYKTLSNGRTSEHLLLYRNFNVRPLNLRINSACFTGDIFGESSCDCNWQLVESLAYIARRNQGLMIYHLHHEGRGLGIVNKLRRWRTPMEFAASASHLEDARTYASSLCILHDLGIREVCLLTNNPQKQRILEENHVSVVQRVPVVSNQPHLVEYYRRKRELLNHFV